MKKVILDFKHFKCRAELFDSPVADALCRLLPLEVPLTQWGKELYGPVGADCGQDDPVTDIPPGGIAYTNRGNLLCVFFGQKPAWEVEYIGTIINEEWQKLISMRDPDSLCISIERD